MFKKVIKNTSILSVGTFISLSLGLVRDILIATFFGTTGILEAFIVAFRLPNLFRSIFGEGFSDAVSTPILSEYQKDKKKLLAIGNNLLSLAAVSLLIFSVVGVVFSKYFVMILAPGFIAQADKFNLAVSYTRITFFYLFFIGVSVNSMSILAALKKFFIPAINPAFLNISFIVGIPFFVRFFENYILVICVIVAGLLQIALPLFALRREGFSFRFSLPRAMRDSEIVRMLKIFPPRIFSSIIYQLSVIVDTIFASLTQIVGQGALAALWYAHRFVHFPLALISLPISRVATVDLSYFHREDKIDDFKRLFVFSFQNIVFFVIPLSVLYLFIPGGIIDVVFRRGDFNLQSLHITSSVLFFYAFGLFFFCGIKLLVSSFYALKDTVTPAKITALSLIVNIVLSALLMFPLKIGGVALGSSLAALVNFLLLYRSLIRKIGAIDWQDTRTQSLKVIVLSLVVGLIVRILWHGLGFSRYVKMALIVVVSLLLFAGGGLLIGLKHLHYLKRWVSENSKRK